MRRSDLDGLQGGVGLEARKLAVPCKVQDYGLGAQRRGKVVATDTSLFGPCSEKRPYLSPFSVPLDLGSWFSQITAHPAQFKCESLGVSPMVPKFGGDQVFALSFLVPQNSGFNWENFSIVSDEYHLSKVSPPWPGLSVAHGTIK